MAHAAQSYYFNASRWVCTGESSLPVTWGNVRSGDWQGITVSKVAKIALLCIPAFVLDLLRMAIDRCFFKHRAIAVQPGNLGAAELRQENAAELSRHLQIPDIVPLALSFLPPHEAACAVEQTAQMVRVANGYRGIDFDHVTLGTLRYIATLPNPSRFYAEIRGLKLGDEKMTGADFVALARLLTPPPNGEEPPPKQAQLRSVQFPRGLKTAPLLEALQILDTSQLGALDFSGIYPNKGSDMTDPGFLEVLDRVPSVKDLTMFRFCVGAPLAAATVTTAIRKVSNSLERIQLDAADDQLIRELIACSKLTHLEIGSFFTPRNAINFHPRSPLDRLFAQGRLRSFGWWGGRANFKAFTAVCRQCPIKHLDLSISHLEELPVLWVKALFENQLAQNSFVSFSGNMQNISEDNLRALAELCPNLQVFGFLVLKNQHQLFKQLLPQWRQLVELKARRVSMSEDELVEIVQASPSLNTIDLAVDETNDSETYFLPTVIEKLSALNRPLTLRIQWWGKAINQARREALFAAFPHLNIVCQLGLIG